MFLAIPFPQKRFGRHIVTFCVEDGFCMAIGVDKCELSILKITKEMFDSIYKIRLTLQFAMAIRTFIQ